MSTVVVIGIVMLVAVSLIVRVAPAFIPLPVSNRTIEKIDTLLPVAVFINLGAYCAVSEIAARPIVGGAGVAALFLLFPVAKRIGLVTTVASATAVYLFAAHGPLTL
ncbi:hypothetical protein [Ferruginivarius sediminum]|uniref:AzlD domain-containing protein n=1 Tax=Ferruginivarius sediminum TaxID=2661937 RepID=A0A369T8E8_9PROT|nr:hypothetical protein [Ferruginivarius sediminum]RDD61583.1 hypothetical protein DRB17_11645 [Ferruginivarius sediminum]